MSDRRLDSFQKLALATTGTTYLLILVGGLVRAAGAGLGCPDWPRCFGSWVPPTRADQLPPGFDPAQFNAVLTWIEYLNRLLGVLVGFLIFATLLAAIARHRRTPRVLRPTLAAFLLVGYEGWLGGQVVAHGLQPWIVTAHLVVALLIVSLLLYATVSAFFPAVSAAAPHRRLVARAGWALLALTLAQVALGTQVRSRVDEVGGRDAGARAASPVPRSEWLSRAGPVDGAHRTASLLVLAGALGVFGLVRRRETGGPLAAAAGTVVALTGAQIGTGVVLAYLALPRTAQVAHLALASLLLGAETLVALLARRLPETPAPDRPSGTPAAPSRLEAAPRG